MLPYASAKAGAREKRSASLSKQSLWLGGRVDGQGERKRSASLSKQSLWLGGRVDGQGERKRSGSLSKQTIAHQDKSGSGLFVAVGFSFSMSKRSILAK
jgi:hypothetical protein